MDWRIHFVSGLNWPGPGLLRAKLNRDRRFRAGMHCLPPGVWAASSAPPTSVCLADIREVRVI